MAKQRLVETSIWQDKWFLKLSGDAKLLFIFLITSPLTKESGFIEIPDSLLVPYLYPIARITKARKELYPKVMHDPKTDLYLITNFYKKNCKSPTMVKPAVNDLRRHANSPLSAVFCRINDNVLIFKELDIPHIYPTDTLSVGCNERDSDNSYISSFKKEECEEKTKPVKKDQAIFDYTIGDWKDIPKVKYDYWKSMYPDIDLDNELRKMAVWLNEHDHKKDFNKFIANWLNNSLGEFKHE